MTPSHVRCVGDWPRDDMLSAPLKPLKKLVFTCEDRHAGLKDDAGSVVLKTYKNFFYTEWPDRRQEKYDFKHIGSKCVDDKTNKI